jgi:hypothetical protein
VTAGGCADEVTITNGASDGFDEIDEYAAYDGTFVVKDEATWLHGRPVYSNQEGKFLFFVATVNTWVVNDELGQFDGWELAAFGQPGAACPDRASDWRCLRTSASCALTVTPGRPSTPEPTSAPTASPRADCAMHFTLSGQVLANRAGYLGTFVLTDIVCAECDGRPVYRKENAYMHYSPTAGGWLVSSDYTTASWGVGSFSSAGDWCPKRDGDWRDEAGCGSRDPPCDIVVAPCTAQPVIAGGSSASQQGRYEIVLDVTVNGWPTYHGWRASAATHPYLTYLTYDATRPGWQVSSEPNGDTSNGASLYMASDAENLCPVDATGWFDAGCASDLTLCTIVATDASCPPKVALSVTDTSDTTTSNYLSGYTGVYGRLDDMHDGWPVYRHSAGTNYLVFDSSDSTWNAASAYDPSFNNVKIITGGGQVGCPDADASGWTVYSYNYRSATVVFSAYPAGCSESVKVSGAKNWNSDYQGIFTMTTDLRHGRRVY